MNRINKVLDNPQKYTWTIQGFGFIRCYPFNDGDRTRLNVWDSALTYPDVTLIHDHPWDFTSEILYGRIMNRRYDMTDSEPATHEWQYIITGIEASVATTKRQQTRLIPWELETYGPGDKYSQRKREIHKSTFDDGTVTVNDRTNRDEPSMARVFWPWGQEWGNAKPRAATMAEVEAAISKVNR